MYTPMCSSVQLESVDCQIILSMQYCASIIFDTVHDTVPFLFHRVFVQSLQLESKSFLIKWITESVFSKSCKEIKCLLFDFVYRFKFINRDFSLSYNWTILSLTPVSPSADKVRPPCRIFISVLTRIVKSLILRDILLFSILGFRGLKSEYVYFLVQIYLDVG